MKLRGAERLLERLAATECAIKAIRSKEIFVVENDIVDANDLLFAQLEVVQSRARLVHVHAEGEVGIVVEVGAGADDPVDEAGLDERHKSGDTEASRREGAAERQTDDGIGGEHLGR